MTPDKILTVLKEATNTFGNIAAKPTDDDMLHMNRTLLLILLKIPYNQFNNIHNFSGLVLPSDKYITKYGMVFQCATRPKPYTTTLSSTMSDAEQQKSEDTHSARK